MSSVANSNSGIKAMSSNGGDGVEERRSFSEWLMEWGNSPGVALIWGIIGCICSFFCPMFLFLEEGESFCYPGPIRMMIMLLTCVAMGGLYRVGFMLRNHRIMREEPSLLVYMIGQAVNILMVIVFGSGVNRWCTVVGLELLVVGCFVLFEMAKPVNDFYMLRTVSCLPVVVAFNGDGAWNRLSLGWPTTLFVLPILLEAWKEFFIIKYKKGKV